MDETGDFLSRRMTAYQLTRAWDPPRTGQQRRTGQNVPSPGDYDPVALLDAEAEHEAELQQSLVWTLPRRGNPGWGNTMPLTRYNVGGEPAPDDAPGAQIPALLMRRSVRRG